jgi:hypothetical protein
LDVYNKRISFLLGPLNNSQEEEKLLEEAEKLSKKH